MDILKRAVQVELERIEKVIQEYELELEKLPDGYLSKKTINGKIYYYIQKREEDKIISNYAGKEDCDVEQISQQLEKRKHIKIMLKALNREKKKAEKIEELDAVSNLYESKLYEKLKEEETKLWHLSPKALYELYKQEKVEGHIDWPTEM